MPMRYHRTPPDYRTAVLRVGHHQVIRRPHHGCGDAPYLYDILDAGGRVMRTVASHPSAADCASAVGVVRPADAIDHAVAQIEDRTTWNSRKTVRGRRAA